MTKKDVPKLTPGSRYRVLSMMTRDEPLVSEGVFKGYTVVGNMDALCMEIEGEEAGGGSEGGSGKKSSKKKKANKYLRLIPGQMIISVDILSQAKEKKEEDPSPESRYYL